MAYIVILLLALPVIYAEPPTGGALCTSNKDCPGGSCFFNTTVLNTTFGVCQCPSDRGNVDCSYQRLSRGVAGSIELIGDLLGIGGGYGQLMLGFYGWAAFSFIFSSVHTIGLIMILAVVCGQKCGRCEHSDNDLGGPHTTGDTVLTLGIVITVLGGAFMALVIPFTIATAFSGKVDGYGYATIA